MDFWNETNWYAVQSQPHRENLAAANVLKLDAEVFLPRIRQEQLVCGVKRSLIKALFTGYFFAKFAPVLLFDAVRYAQGVLRVVGTGSFPTPLDEGIISAIRGRVHTDGFIQLKAAPLQSGEQVIIERGPFRGWMGQVERESNDGTRVMILLDAIEHARLSVEKRWLTVP
jgi:transcription antitermination factor NusG